MPAARETPRCRNCRFFMPDAEDPEGNYGYCRRYPPTASDFNGHVPQVVDHEWWCGEHQPADATRETGA